MRKTVRTLCAAGGAMLVLAGCMDRDPYRRTDVWRPTGSNAANIAAMVANPRDMIQGQEPARKGADSNASVRAVERIAVDRPKALPTTGSTTGGTGGGGGGGAGAGGAAGG